MIKTPFRTKDAHFWMSIIFGLAYFLEGLAGTIDSLGFPLQLSWKVFQEYPIDQIESMPWSLILCIAGLLLFLDSFRVFKVRWQRFLIWGFMMLCLWGMSGMFIWTTFMNLPHVVGLTLITLSSTISYSCLFLLGPPLTGQTDVTWEE